MLLQICLSEQATSSRLKADESLQGQTEDASEDERAQQLDQRDGWDDADSALLGLELPKSDCSLPEIDQEVGSGQQPTGSCTPPTEPADLSCTSTSPTASFTNKSAVRVSQHHGISS